MAILAASIRRAGSARSDSRLWECRRGTCAQNALRLVELKATTISPSQKAAANRLRPRTLHLVLGKDGFGNTNPPPPRGRLDPRHAAQFIIDTVMAHPHEVTLMPLGPLTNIALACILEPGIIPLVSEVVLMGGVAFALGNISPVAEANIFHDPHAAEVVFAAPWKVTMIGLDVTMKIIMTPEYLAKLYAAGTPAVKLLERIQPCYQNFHHAIHGMGGAIHTHDPAVTAYLLAPELFTCEQMPVYVETSGLCFGKTIADKYHKIFPSLKLNQGIGGEAGEVMVKHR